MQEEKERREIREKQFELEPNKVHTFYIRSKQELESFKHKKDNMTSLKVLEVDLSELDTLPELMLYTVSEKEDVTDNTMQDIFSGRWSGMRSISIYLNNKNKLTNDG